MIQKILYLEAGTSAGGSFTSLYNLVTNIDRSRFEAVVVFLNENSFIEKLRKSGFTVYLLDDMIFTVKGPFLKKKFYNQLVKIPRILPALDLLIEKFVHKKTINKIVEIIEKENISLVHLNNQPFRDIFGIEATRKTKKVCVSHVHSYFRKKNFPFLRRNYISDHVNCFIFAANNVKTSWLPYLGEVVTKTVYNGINIPECNDNVDIRSQYNILEKSFLICAVGQLISYKGQEFLLNAFAAFLEEDKESFLVLAGDGIDRQKLQDLARSLSIEKHVVFTGHTDHAREIIAEADLLIQPSQTEVCSMVLIEGMALKTPIIATEVGGNPELIQEGFNGALVSYGDTKQLANKIRYFKENSQKTREYVENGFERYKDTFSITKFVSDISQIYEDELKPL